MMEITMFGGPCDGKILRVDDTGKPVERLTNPKSNGTYHVFDDFAMYVEPDEEVIKTLTRQVEDLRQENTTLRNAINTERKDQ